MSKVSLPVLWTVRHLLAVFAVLTLGAIMAVSASAAVSPTSHDYGVVEAGATSDTVVKTVTVPDSTPKLDFVLLVDLSGSYWDDLLNIKPLMPGVWDDLALGGTDLQSGLTTFIDFPFASWGTPTDFGNGVGDYAYRLDQDLTSDKLTWTTAVNGMLTNNGLDSPESQYEGLYQTASGAGRDVNGDGDYADLGDIAPGTGINWRPGATRVIAITTDASFHDPGDSGSLAGGWPGAGFADTVAALNAENIIVIALKAPGSTTQMDDIANATDGSVVTTSSTSSDIATAILAGIDDIEQEVTGTITSCDPSIVATLNLTPTTATLVTAGSTVLFDESITVDAGAAPGSYTCEVTFTWGDAVVGVQTITFEVPSSGDDDRFMTGGGNVNLGGKGKNAERYTWGFEIRCDGSSANFQFKDHKGKNVFHLESITSVSCTDTGVDPSPPDAAFDTLTLVGEGRLNGVSGTSVVVTLTDAGEPGGIGDTIDISIGGGSIVLSGGIGNGNHQAH